MMTEGTTVLTMHLSNEKGPSKKEQLRIAFTILIKDLLCKLAFDIDVDKNIVHTSIDDATNSMVKEVSIRTDLR